MTKNTLRRWSSPEMILVATNLLDGPALMLHAVSQAKLTGAKVLLVHVIRPAYLRADSEYGLPFVLPGPAIRTARAMLDELTSQFQQEGVLCEPMVLKGLPQEQIPLLVKSRQVDRVLVATRHPRGVERLLERSVAEELMAILDVPVCMIGRHADSHALSKRSPGQVLVATSLKPGSAHYVRFAFAFAEFHNAHLTLLHVLDTEGVNEVQRQQARISAEQKLSATVAGEAPLWCKPVLSIREGDTTYRILDEASAMPPGFIILGAPTPSHVIRLLDVSIVHRVVTDARCPVITLKPLASIEEQIEHECFHFEISSAAR